MENTQAQSNSPAAPAAKPAAPSAPAAAPSAFGGGARSGGRGGFGGGRGGDRRGPRRDRRPEEPKEFDQRILSLDRVTRVTKGGKRMRFRATVIIGDHKGRVGYGVAKAADVSAAVNKAVTQAKKRVMTVPLVHETIPHMVASKFGSASILMKPAPKGTGVKAGGAMRVVLELAGVPNIVGKILGGKNKINNTKATIEGLRSLRLKAPAAKMAV
jgi:small subunit ribosomal protein S5